MNKVIVVAKYTDQTTQYDYVRKTVTRTFNADEPISKIFYWVKSNNYETESLIIRPDESEVGNV